MTAEAFGGSTLQTWICDACSEPITDPAKALVTWKNYGEHYWYQSFLIVHKSIDGRRCDPGAQSGYNSSLDLDMFLGPEGLTMLLSWLSIGPLKGGGGTRIAPEGLDAYVDLVRRVQIPHYEEARSKFGDEDTEHWLGDANEYYPYIPDVLDRVANGTLRR